MKLSVLIRFNMHNRYAVLELISKFPDLYRVWSVPAVNNDKHVDVKVETYTLVLQ